MRGALRILGGMVQMAAGMTRLLAVAALKAAEAAADAVKAAEADEDEPEPKPKPALITCGWKLASYRSDGRDHRADRGDRSDRFDGR